MATNIDSKLLRISAWVLIILACFSIFIGLAPKSYVLANSGQMPRYAIFISVIEATGRSPVFLIGLAAGFLADHLDGANKNGKSTPARMIMLFLVSVAIGFMMLVRNT